MEVDSSLMFEHENDISLAKEIYFDHNIGSCKFLIKKKTNKQTLFNVTLNY